MVVNERNMSAIDDGSSGLSNIGFTGQIGINVFASTMHVRHILSMCSVIFAIISLHFHNFNAKTLEFKTNKSLFFFARKSLFIFSLLLKHSCSCHIDNSAHSVLALPDGNRWLGETFVCFNENCSRSPTNFFR